MATAAYTSAYSAAADTDQREDGRSHPTLTTRWIPTACAAASTPSTGSPRMSMWLCASKPPGSGSAAPSGSAGGSGEAPPPFGLLIGAEPGDFLVNHGLIHH